MHWSWTLYDWYIQNSKANPCTAESGVTWPIILDADDIMLSPDLVTKYSTLVGARRQQAKILMGPC